MKLFYFFLVLLLCQCTRPPEKPNLKNESARASQIRILNQNISVKDVKTLFQALNEHQDLEAFRHLFENLSDSVLSDFTVWFSNSFLKKSEMIQQIIEKRIAKRSFSQLLSQIEEWPKDPHYKLQKSFLKRCAAWESLYDMIQLDHVVLNPEFSKSFKGFRISGQTIPFDSKGLSKDILEFSKNELAKKELESLIRDIQEQELGNEIYKIFSTNYRKHGSAFWKTFSNHWAALVTEFPSEDQPIETKEFQNKNNITLLLSLFHTLARQSEPLIEGLENREKVWEQFGRIIRPQIIWAYGAEYYRKLLSEPKFNLEFWKQLAKIRNGDVMGDSFKNLYGLSKEYLTGLQDFYIASDRDFFRSLNVATQAFFLTVYVERWAQQNIRSIEKIKNSDELKIFLSSAVTSSKDLEMPFFDDENPKKFKFEKQFLALGEADLIKALPNYAKALEDKPYNYHSEAFSDLGIEKILKSVLVELDSSQFIDGGIDLMKLIQKFIPAIHWKKEISRSNLLDMFNTAVRLAPIIFTEKAVSILVKDMEFKNLEAKYKTQIVDFFDTIKPQLNVLLDSNFVLESFLEKRKEPHSLLFQYRELLQPVSHYSLVSNLFSFLKESQWLEVSKEKNKTASARYPTFFSYFSNTDFVSQALEFLARQALKVQKTWRETLSHVLGNELEGVSVHFRFLSELAEKKPEEFSAFLETFPKVIPELQYLELQEFNWIQHLLGQKETRTLWQDILNSNTSFYKIFNNLRKLYANGGLKRVIYLLSLIQNESINRLSQTLSQLTESNEFPKLLRIAEIILVSDLEALNAAE